MASPLKLEKYDIIICGGGTAGCVLANRLTENADLTVLMLEAGEDASKDFRVTTPGLVPLLLGDPDRDWNFMGEASSGLGGRKMAYPRGKCIGGSSAINLMALVYQSKAGMDAWAELGNHGWDWESMKPYYKKFQCQWPPSDEIKDALSIDYLDPEYHGSSGPISSSYPATLDPLQKAWADTWKSLNKTITGDPVQGLQTGGYTSTASVNPKTGERSYAGNEYYSRAADRPNLHVVTDAMIEKLELNGTTPDEVVATGVTFSHAGGRHTAQANMEIVICAGTFGSSSLLELSGIGSKELCSRMGIRNIIDNPNVGENLQDHIMCGPSFEVRDGVATADMMRDPSVAAKATEEYQNSRSGPLAQGAGYSFAYTPLTDFLTAEPKEDLKCLLDKYKPPSRASEQEKQHYAFIRRIVESPTDASATMCMIAVQVDFSRLDPKEMFGINKPGNYASFLTTLAHPFARGSVHISSADPRAHPTISPNFYSHELDLEVVARHLMQIETFVRAEPIASFLKPGGRRLPQRYNANTLENAKEFARHNSSSMYHPCGTCAMKPRKSGGVVDERLKVHGTKNLRVCDASIFPINARGNIQTCVYAVAEKGADIIKEDLAKEKN